MLVLISPAKLQNTKANSPTSKYTLPLFGNEAKYLINMLKSFSISELMELFKSNFKIAEENAERFMKWRYPHSLNDSKQAIFTYSGAVFKSFDPMSLESEGLDYAQNHLRILSGLYGLLRPLDLIMPYRLDVSTKLENSSGESLYPFWSDKITNEINVICDQIGASFIINLMSKEYLRVLDVHNIKKTIINIDFLDFQPNSGEYKPVVIYTKKARGEMARYIIENKITHLDKIFLFDKMGYQYSEELSGENNFVFIR